MLSLRVQEHQEESDEEEGDSEDDSDEEDDGDGEEGEEDERLGAMGTRYSMRDRTRKEARYSPPKEEQRERQRCVKRASFLEPTSY